MLILTILSKVWQNIVLVVAVAQLVESRIVIPVVVGSSPISHPNKFNHLAQFFSLGFLLFRIRKTNVTAM